MRNIPLLVLLLLTCLNIGSTAEIIAKVNDKPITQEQLVDKLLVWLGNQALEELINQEIVLQEAVRKKVKVDDKEVEERLDEGLSWIKGSFPAEQFYRQWLENVGKVFFPFWRQQIKVRLIAEKIVSPNIKITDKDILEYNKMLNEFVKARHIFLKTEEEAKKVLGLCRAGGADFIQLAKEYSQDPVTKETGGDLGYIRRGMAPELEKVLFSLAAGEISDVVKSTAGYHIIKVEDKKVAKEPSLEEKGKLRKQLFQLKLDEAVDKWFNELKSKAKIEILKKF